MEAPGGSGGNCAAAESLGGVLPRLVQPMLLSSVQLVSPLVRQICYSAHSASSECEPNFCPYLWPTVTRNIMKSVNAFHSRLVITAGLRPFHPAVSVRVHSACSYVWQGVCEAIGQLEESGPEAVQARRRERGGLSGTSGMCNSGCVSVRGRAGMGRGTQWHSLLSFRTQKLSKVHPKLHICSSSADSKATGPYCSFCQSSTSP